MDALRSGTRVVAELGGPFGEAARHPSSKSMDLLWHHEATRCATTRPDPMPPFVRDVLKNFLSHKALDLLVAAWAFLEPSPPKEEDCGECPACHRKYDHAG